MEFKEISFELFGFLIDFDTKTFGLGLGSVSLGTKTKNFLFVQLDGLRLEIFEFLYITFLDR